MLDARKAFEVGTRTAIERGVPQAVARVPARQGRGKCGQSAVRRPISRTSPRSPAKRQAPSTDRCTATPRPTGRSTSSRALPPGRSSGLRAEEDALAELLQGPRPGPRSRVRPRSAAEKRREHAGRRAEARTAGRRRRRGLMAGSSPPLPERLRSRSCSATPHRSGSTKRSRGPGRLAELVRRGRLGGKPGSRRARLRRRGLGRVRGLRPRAGRVRGDGREERSSRARARRVRRVRPATNTSSLSVTQMGADLEP